jgi:hypothetical protein
MALNDDNLLVLGWQVNTEGHPIYWLNENAKVGLQHDSDLLRVSADLMDSHTVIVAQSGSGKSFFLGRLVEELLMRTKCRCLIFDPTGIFPVWIRSMKMYGKRAAMTYALATHYCLMTQRMPFCHPGEGFKNE